MVIKDFVIFKVDFEYLFTIVNTTQFIINLQEQQSIPRDILIAHIVSGTFLVFCRFVDCFITS